jgi:hypothetical protein
MCTEFLLEAWKHKKKRLEGTKQTHRKGRQSIEKLATKKKQTKWAYRKLHTYETLYKIIQSMNTANADIL